MKIRYLLFSFLALFLLATSSMACGGGKSNSELLFSCQLGDQSACADFVFNGGCIENEDCANIEFCNEEFECERAF